MYVCIYDEEGKDERINRRKLPQQREPHNNHTESCIPGKTDASSNRYRSKCLSLERVAAKCAGSCSRVHTETILSAHSLFLTA